MQNLIMKGLLEKYPVLKSSEGSALFITKDDFEKYQSDDKISIHDSVKTKDISILLLSKLITDNVYYNYVQKLFSDEIEEFVSYYTVNGNAAGDIRLSKTDIVRGIAKIINEKGIAFDEEAQKRYQSLYHTVSFDKLLKNIVGKNYEVTIDGEKLFVSIEEMFTFLTSDEAHYEEFFDLEKNNKINGIRKEYFAYSIVRYFARNSILDNYILPSNVMKRFMEIRSSEKIDIEALNKITITRNDNLSFILINDELRKELYDGLPKDLSTIEKAIYFYIKMCKTLTYDEEFFAVNQRGQAAEKHKDIKQLSTINTNNNRVVCYEFNAIYSKLLEENGINFEVLSKMSKKFGEDHTSLRFRCGKFLINADPVTSILLGDMMLAKINQPLIGLTCENKNEQTKREFAEIMSRVYNLVVKEEQVKQEGGMHNTRVGHVETFEEILGQYRSITDNVKPVSIEDKINILIDKASSKSIVGVDNLSYINQLRKIIFTKDEQLRNVGMAIVRNNKPEDPGKTAMPKVVFTINQENVLTNADNNEYYFYNPNGSLVPTDKKTLEESFSSGILEYISDSSKRIPGIYTKGGKRK